MTFNSSKVQLNGMNFYASFKTIIQILTIFLVAFHYFL